MSAKESQNRMVLEHLKKFGGITSMEAIELYGITRLSGRIYDLRHLGYVIKGTTMQCVNRFGKVVRFRRYELVA